MSKRYVDDTDDPEPNSKRKKLGPFVQVSGIVKPESYCENWKAPWPLFTETKALFDLNAVWSKQEPQSGDFKIWELDNFSIYQPHNTPRYGGEMIALHNLSTKQGVNELLFDGVLRVGTEERYLQGVRFRVATVEGYGHEENKGEEEQASSPEVTICLQSILGARSDAWYRLGSPAPAYSRYHTPFLWIAQLGKFFVDYLTENKAVSLAHFRQSFFSLINARYSETPAFKKWCSQYQSTDFRQAVHAYARYLWNESGTLGNEELLKHPVWEETLDLNAVPKVEKRQTKTVVTPYVLQCFKNMPFAHKLKALPLSNQIAMARKSRRDKLHLTPVDCQPTVAPSLSRNKPDIIREGDVVCLPPDINTKWKPGSVMDWFAYVQHVHIAKDGSKKLDLLWLYHPEDTTLGKGLYPYKNELFMSDNCMCGAEARDASDVIAKVAVTWFASNPESTKSFFVRQKYRTNHASGAYDFQSLKYSDFKCPCKDDRTDMEEVLANYRIGDTVLVRQVPPGQTEEYLEPAQIVGFSSTVSLQRLLRSARDLGRQAKPNELAFGEDIYRMSASRIVRGCYVQCFSSIAHIHTPFDRDGAGDFYYIIGSNKPVRTPGGPPLRQGGILLPPPNKKLKGLGLFSGGGGLDRGLEEGGHVSFKYSVDWNTEAIHSYRANSIDPGDIEFFLGSVDDFLAKAFRRDSASITSDKRIPAVGDVDFIAAGSPCPGFSALQMYKESDKAMSDCSRVCSVMSGVDLFVPLQMVLENVRGIAKTPPKHPEHNVFSQILCCLVAMGYQVQQFLMDPTGYGAPESRLRVFIVATAPNNRIPDRPPQTHSYPDGRWPAIGLASNGEPFATLTRDVAPLDFTTLRQALGDLPDIADAHVKTCIRYPDHQICRRENELTRNLIAQIPRWPAGQGMVDAYRVGTLGSRQRSYMESLNSLRRAEISRAWSRVKGDGIITCLTTRLQPHDAFQGATIHWQQHRLLTVMEARRIQSIPDDEVVIGSPVEQWKIIGNGVDRKVSFALGLAIGRAWLETWKDGDARQGNINIHHANLYTSASLRDTEDNSIRAISYPKKKATTTAPGLLTPSDSGHATPAAEPAYNNSSTHKMKLYTPYINPSQSRQPPLTNTHRSRGEIRKTLLQNGLTSAERLSKQNAARTPTSLSTKTDTTTHIHPSESAKAAACFTTARASVEHREKSGAAYSNDLAVHSSSAAPPTAPTTAPPTDDTDDADDTDSMSDCVIISSRSVAQDRDRYHGAGKRGSEGGLYVSGHFSKTNMEDGVRKSRRSDGDAGALGMLSGNGNSTSTSSRSDEVTASRDARFGGDGGGGGQGVVSRKTRNSGDGKGLVVPTNWATTVEKAISKSGGRQAQE